MTLNKKINLTFDMFVNAQSQPLHMHISSFKIKILMRAHILGAQDALVAWKLELKQIGTEVTIP